MRKVTVPMPNPLCCEMPCANTVHGVEPSCALTSMPSPTPNNTSAKHNTHKDFGRSDHGLGADQGVSGRIRLA